MALKACRECGKEISTGAKRCPNCGKKDPTTSYITQCMQLILWLVLIMLVLSFIASLADYGSVSPYAVYQKELRRQNQIQAEAEAQEQRARFLRSRGLPSAQAAEPSEVLKYYEPPASQWVPDGQPIGVWRGTAMHLWVGVKLFYGPNKLYVGEVLGGNMTMVNPRTGESFNGLKLRMANGSTRWYDRSDVVLGPWYVRADDPALLREDWVECNW